MYTDRRIGQYTVGTPRAAIVWSVAVHLIVFIGSACAWDDGAARSERAHKTTPARLPDPPFLFWDHTGARRLDPPAVVQAVMDAITQFAPAAEKAHERTPLVRRYHYPIWIPEESVESEPPVPKRYDSVVIASAAASFFPGTEGLLSGDVVYTVYLRAGSSRDWVLQFSSRETATTMDPPYPARAVIPQVTLPPEVEFMVIHGMMSAQGRFEKLAIIGDQPLSPDPETLLRSLSEWEFQPAALNSGAIPVDVVLIVPNSRTTDAPPFP